MRINQQFGTGITGTCIRKVPVPAIIISILIIDPNSFGWISEYLFFLYLTKLSVSEAIWHRTVGRLINMNWKWSGTKPADTESLSCNLPEGTQEKLLKISVIPRSSSEPCTSSREVRKHYQLIKLPRWYKWDFSFLTGFGGLVVSMLASGTQDRGFDPGRSRRIFRAKKSTVCLPWGGK